MNYKLIDHGNISLIIHDDGYVYKILGRPDGYYIESGGIRWHTRQIYLGELGEEPKLIDYDNKKYYAEPRRGVWHVYACKQIEKEKYLQKARRKIKNLQEQTNFYEKVIGELSHS